ncbi:MAG: ATP-binding cassette domain-containing protein [Bacteroidales bacterium]|nr:ATP-binding cassette domain-containing protein [Bacteroidales bacterium]OQB68726.1 MAG: Lipoprotein-releasing system ATP-binding protein LolD [Bacteroidetes bacterium ADurb.Bin139]HOG25924.1 ATP-binding cassette domain-containing protein [Bacteroidales bacterium]HOR12033.1 ATP-binding cassette domain-containing protein [Bacteroidales bacterium]HOZ19791.1 ATP-binding cassette domain-containing protein [Bacteroidales bacterium]
MTDNAIVTLRKLYKRFPAGKGTFTALKDINLTFGKGEFSGIVGPSGSGKTTLLNIIGSLDTPSEGTATVLGKKINDLSQKEAAALRNVGIGFIFQTYNLLPVYTVYENVEFALLLQKTGQPFRWRMPARGHLDRIIYLKDGAVDKDELC